MYPGGLEPPLAKTVLVKSLIVKMGPPGRFTIPIHPEKRGEGKRVRGPTSVGVVGGETGKHIRKQIGKFNRRLALSSKWKMCASRPKRVQVQVHIVPKAQVQEEIGTCSVQWSLGASPSSGRGSRR